MDIDNERQPSRYAWVVDLILVLLAVALAVTALVVAWRYIEGIS